MLDHGDPTPPVPAVSGAFLLPPLPAAAASAAPAPPLSPAASQTAAAPSSSQAAASSAPAAAVKSPAQPPAFKKGGRPFFRNLPLDFFHLRYYYHF